MKTKLVFVATTLSKSELVQSFSRTDALFLRHTYTFNSVISLASVVQILVSIHHAVGSSMRLGIIIHISTPFYHAYSCWPVSSNKKSTLSLYACARSFEHRRIIQELSLIPVTTLQEVLDIISIGLKLRATHETKMNQVSFRMGTSMMEDGGSDNPSDVFRIVGW